MSDFKDVFQSYDWDLLKEEIYDKSPVDVEQALHKEHADLEDFKALVSPSAGAYLEPLAQKSQDITLRRFGKTIQLFAPFYLSNECQNICTYCGFSLDNPIRRKTLNPNEIDREIKAIKSLGFQHVLLVTGEANKTVGVDYLERAIKQIQPHFANVSMEVQPLDQEDYERLITAGLHTVLVYQETYHEKDYKKHHPKGKKSNFWYRLETPDRLGKAGIHKMGLGALIGLEDWRVDSFFVATHLDYLQRRYWRSKYTLSFPRLRPFSGGLEPKVPMNDRELAQLICAYRIFNHDVELSLSTRETQNFRNNILRMGITTMSAGSKTNPGGYSVDPQSLEQFEISDERSPSEIVEVIKSAGYEPVWKDWDPSYQLLS